MTSTCFRLVYIQKVKLLFPKKIDFCLSKKCHICNRGKARIESIDAISNHFDSIYEWPFSMIIPYTI